MPATPTSRQHSLSDQALTQVNAWREQHPHATLQQIEQAVDEHLAPLRAKLIEDAALASPLHDLTTLTPEQRPTCANCQQPLEPQGQSERTLTTNHEQSIILKRSYALCPQCQQGLFPPRR